MADKKLNIFELLPAVNNKDYHFYENLTAEEQKGFAPIVVQRWLSGSGERSQILIANETLNPYVFSLADHKNLLYKLMVNTSNGYVKYSYPKQTKKNESTKPVSIKVLVEKNGLSKKQAKRDIDMYSVDDIIEAAFDLGYEDTELKKIRKEFK